MYAHTHKNTQTEAQPHTKHIVTHTKTLKITQKSPLHWPYLSNATETGFSDEPNFLCFWFCTTPLVEIFLFLSSHLPSSVKMGNKSHFQSEKETIKYSLAKVICIYNKGWWK